MNLARLDNQALQQSSDLTVRPLNAIWGSLDRSEVILGSEHQLRDSIRNSTARAVD